ncbi:Transposase C of IS166 homeodomain/zinc-finger binding domain of transposase IS66 [Puniceibacterium sp. IMCC21224]|nr:Transposase C of IS166 homeodomain/zinc-finger binding domain of transposase IS66 [Puniceibacterium sp. IMCC21224]
MDGSLDGSADGYAGRIEVLEGRSGRRMRSEAERARIAAERFGRRSEKLDPEQFNLPLEDVELAQGVLDAAQEKARRALKGQGAAESGTPKRNRGHLPKHLPRIERVIEPRSTLCPCGCGEMARIGEDVSERLDVVPAQLRVLVTRCPRYACRRCSGACAGTCRARRTAHRSADRAGHGGQVRRPPSFLPPGRVANAVEIPWQRAPGV